MDRATTNMRADDPVRAAKAAEQAEELMHLYDRVQNAAFRCGYNEGLEGAQAAWKGPAPSLEQAAELLGLPPGVGSSEILEATRRLKKLFHPDKVNGADAAVIIMADTAFGVACECAEVAEYFAGENDFNRTISGVTRSRRETLTEERRKSLAGLRLWRAAPSVGRREAGDYVEVWPSG